MQARCGAWQDGNDIDRGRIEFRVFFPTGPSPEIGAIRVAGDFQQALGDNNWDFAGGLPLTQDTSDPRGSFWTAQTSLELPSGFYQYKYLVIFNDRSTRIVSDPCTRYSGLSDQNAAVVVGAASPAWPWPGTWPRTTPAPPRTRWPTTFVTTPRPSTCRSASTARVTSLTRTDAGFEVRTADQTFRAREVVVATGPFQVPFVPPQAAKLDASVTQLHSADYRNPQALPEGPVLVVGGGNSGFQIAEELAATRTVDLSIATRYPMLPQRLGGRDLFWWLTASACCGSPSPPGPAGG